MLLIDTSLWVPIFRDPSGAVAQRVQDEIGAEGNVSRALPLSPWGRGCEAMTYGRVALASKLRDGNGADVSHLPELVRGNFSDAEQSPLIRPFGAPSPQGEKGYSCKGGVA